MSTSSTRPAAAHRLILSVLVPALMAAAAAVVGAGGGREQGPDRETERRESAGKRSTSDSRIESEIESRITRDARIDAERIDAAVDRGRVTLTGSVSRPSVRQTVLERVWSVPGVSDVEDRLVVEAPAGEIADGRLTAERIRSSLIWNPDLDAEEISVSVRGGRVTLGGTVEHLWQKEEAGNTALATTGVRSVTNTIAVVPAERASDETIARIIADKIDRNVYVQADHVDVVVERGEVTLMGTVPDWRALSAAYDAARTTEGVTAVHNSLQVHGGPLEGVYPDEEIEQEIREQLRENGRVDASEVLIDVEDGRVTLGGTVPSHAARVSILGGVRSVRGVRAIRDELTIDLGPSMTSTEAIKEAAINNMLIWNAEIDASDVVASVESGRATLEGTVPALWQKEKAGELVAGVRGITEVSNEIAVVPTTQVLDERIASDIVDALKDIEDVMPNAVTVRVDGGAVTLSGAVPDRRAREEVYEAALYTSGVTEIRDELVIEPESRGTE